MDSEAFGRRLETGCLASCLVLHDDACFLARAVASVRQAERVFAFVSRLLSLVI